MSTRNTVSCMAQSKAAGTAAALCVRLKKDNVRELPYQELYMAFKADKVWFDQERL